MEEDFYEEISENSDGEDNKEKEHDLTDKTKSNTLSNSPIAKNNNLPDLSAENKRNLIERAKAQADAANRFKNKALASTQIAAKPEINSAAAAKEIKKALELTQEAMLSADRVKDAANKYHQNNAHAKLDVSEHFGNTQNKQALLADVITLLNISIEKRTQAQQAREKAESIVNNPEEKAQAAAKAVIKAKKATLAAQRAQTKIENTIRPIISAQNYAASSAILKPSLDSAETAAKEAIAQTNKALDKLSEKVKTELAEAEVFQAAAELNHAAALIAKHAENVKKQEVLAENASNFSDQANIRINKELDKAKFPNQINAKTFDAKLQKEKAVKARDKIRIEKSYLSGNLRIAQEAEAFIAMPTPEDALKNLSDKEIELGMALNKLPPGHASTLIDKTLETAEKNYNAAKKKLQEDAQLRAAKNIKFYAKIIENMLKYAEDQEKKASGLIHLSEAIGKTFQIDEFSNKAQKLLETLKKLTETPCQTEFQLANKIAAVKKALAYIKTPEKLRKHTLDTLKSSSISEAEFSKIVKEIDDLELLSKIKLLAAEVSILAQETENALSYLAPSLVKDTNAAVQMINKIIKLTAEVESETSTETRQNNIKNLMEKIEKTLKYMEQLLLQVQSQPGKKFFSSDNLNKIIISIGTLHHTFDRIAKVIANNYDAEKVLETSLAELKAEQQRLRKDWKTPDPDAGYFLIKGGSVIKARVDKHGNFREYIKEMGFLKTYIFDGNEVIDFIPDYTSEQNQKGLFPHYENLNATAFERIFAPIPFTVNLKTPRLTAETENNVLLDALAIKSLEDIVCLKDIKKDIKHEFYLQKLKGQFRFESDGRVLFAPQQYPLKSTQLISTWQPREENYTFIGHWTSSDNNEFKISYGPKTPEIELSAAIPAQKKFPAFIKEIQGKGWEASSVGLIRNSLYLSGVSKTRSFKAQKLDAFGNSNLNLSENTSEIMTLNEKGEENQELLNNPDIKDYIFKRDNYEAHYNTAENVLRIYAVRHVQTSDPEKDRQKNFIADFDQANAFLELAYARYEATEAVVFFHKNPLIAEYIMKEYKKQRPHGSITQVSSNEELKKRTADNAGDVSVQKAKMKLEEPADKTLLENSEEPDASHRRFSQGFRP